MTYPVPPDDDRRVRALRDLEILDSGDEERFDTLIAELAETLDAPIAYLALIDAERQWVKARVGPLAREVERGQALCSHTILGSEPVVVPDASADPRFASSRLVTEDPKLRFYAGIPISDYSTGQIIGTVCIADQRQRKLADRDLAILQGFARRVADEVNARPVVFVAYAAQDLDWVQRLITRCGPLAAKGLFDLWSDLRVASGDEGDWKLKDALQRARTVVVLLSRAFLKSDFVRRDAFELLLRVREVEGVKTLPVLLEPCDWSGVEWLRDRSPWSLNGKGWVAADPAEIDGLYARLLAEIESTVREVERADPRPEPAPSAAAPAGVAAQPVPVGPAAPRLFLSHASEDAEAVRKLAGSLRQAGLEVWLDLDELKPGDNWMEALEGALEGASAFAVYIGQVGVERWIDREVRVALDRNVKDPSFRVIPILGPGADPGSLPSFLAQHQWLDLRSDLGDPTRIRQLVGGILDRPAEAVSLLAPGEAPFRGLLAFDVGHAHLFYGRDRETQELVERLEAAPFLAVIGDSGSGKSSLVRAGLIPALHSGRFGDGGRQAWRTLLMRPGRDPFRELVNALQDLLPAADPAQRLAVRESCAKQLGRGTDGLCACIGGLAPAGQRTLLVVDQFEEVFTQAADAAERDRFIDTLLAASDASGDRPLHTVITLRADYFSSCFEHPRLPAAVSKNQYPVRAIGRRQLVEVIEKPAAMAGVRLEPGLVEAILHDLGSEASGLALLEHTLLELWKLRLGGTLTHATYESIGRVQGALEHHAEEVYEALDPAQQEIARKLMLRLAAPGKGSSATRRQVARDDLVCPDEAGQSTAEVLHHLVDRRLLTVHRTGGDGDGGADEVEVAHEALLRCWRRFRCWLEEDRDFLQWRQRTRAAFEAWEESGRDPGALLRGGPLEEARRWLGARADDMGDAGRKFISESIVRHRRAYLLKRTAVGAIALLAVVAALAAVFAFDKKQQAEENFAVAKLAMQQVGTMTEVTGQAKAEPPDTVELKSEIAESARNFYRQVKERGGFTADFDFEEAVALYRLGNLYSLQRDGEGAEKAAEAYQEAIGILGELGRRDPANRRYRQELANAHHWRGYARWKAEDFVGAEEDYRRALDAQRSLVDGEPAGLPEHQRWYELGRTENGLGIVLRRQDQDRWPEAEDFYLRARESFRRAVRELESGGGGGDSAERYRQGLAWATTNLGDLRTARGEYAEAETSYRESVSILEELRSPSREIQLELAVTYNNLSNGLLRLERYDEANEKNRRAVEILERLAAPLEEISNELGNSYITRAYTVELDDEIRQALDKARAIYEGLAGSPGTESPVQYRMRQANALAGLADLGDERARVDLCRLLPALPEGQRSGFRVHCP